MKFDVRDRQEGKTTDLVEWVHGGEPTASYPFWTRVIVTINEREASRLRNTVIYNLDYHQVFSVDDWVTARIGPLPVEVAFDNVDMYLQSVIQGKLTLVTATGEA